MSRPHKHPKTGVYWFRKVVPKDLRPMIAKTEVLRSLRTKDPVEARQRHAEIAAEVEREFQGHRRHLAAMEGPLTAELDDTTIERMRITYLHHLLDEDDDVRLEGFAPRERATVELKAIPETWEPELNFDPPTFEAYGSLVDENDRYSRASYARGLPESFYLDEVDEVLSWTPFGIRLGPAAKSRVKAARALTAASIEAAKIIRERNSGEPIPTPPMPEPVAFPRTGATSKRNGPLSLTELVEDWWREARATGRKPSTHESYRNTVAHLVAFLGHDDAMRVTPEDVVGFKDHRLASVNPRTGKPISAKTVKDSDLSALKTLFGWAVTNKRLPTNPAEGITIKLGKRKVTRPKGFTDDEAGALLKAADAHQRGSERPKTFAAKRWVPWLCAYTGARVGEVAQLRKEDVRKVGDHWVLNISPEAGTVKTNEARDVVLHEHLVAKGFPKFVESCGNGHLFVTPAETGDVLGPLQGVKNRLAEAARETVTDPRVQPNHGWRHRFKTVARSVGMDGRVVDAIQGHAPRTAGDDYGDVTVAAMALAMAKFPRQV